MKNANLWSSLYNSKLKTQNSKLVILAVYVIIALLVPPQHGYPIDDDWIYAQAVRDVLHGGFAFPGWAQASQLTHALWGAGFAAIFGFSFTTLAWSMLTLAAIGSLTFYAMLRRLQVGANTALLGALLLACNPILIHLNYSFMTEASFLTYTLLACYCYLRGLQDGGERWLWLGGAMSGVALLDRQFGVMVAVAALLYLLLKRQLKWRRAFAVALLPALALGGLLIWQANQPPAEINVQTAAQVQALLHNPPEVIWEHLSRLLITLPVLGLFAPLAFHWRSRVFAVYATILMAAVIGWYVYSDTTSFDYNDGNIFDSGGFMPPVMFYFRIVTLGPTWLWFALSIVAALLTAGLLAAATEAAAEWWHCAAHPLMGETLYVSPPRERGWGWVYTARESLAPSHFVYLAGALVGLPGLLITANFMDRYLIPLLPFLILAALRRPNRANNASPLLNLRLKPRSHPTYLIPRYSCLIVLIAFSLITQRDYFAYAQARWDAGEWVISQGVAYTQLDGGYEWNGWWLYEQAAAQVRGKVDVQYPPTSPAGPGFPPDAVIDPIWRLEINESEGYRTIKQFGYTSWLDGGKTHYVLALKKQ